MTQAVAEEIGHDDAAVWSWHSYLWASDRRKEAEGSDEASWSYGLLECHIELHTRVCLDWAVT